MRFVLIIATMAILSGCSAIMPVGTSAGPLSAAETLPPDYLQVLRDYLGAGEFQVSQPLRIGTWDLGGSPQWMVCTRNASGREEAYAYSNGRIAGRVGRPRPDSLLSVPTTPTDNLRVHTKMVSGAYLDTKTLDQFCGGANYRRLNDRPETAR